MYDYVYRIMRGSQIILTRPLNLIRLLTSNQTLTLKGMTLELREELLEQGGKLREMNAEVGVLDGC